MKYNPADSQWVDRDRFVLSSGHGCMLQYSVLHLAGYSSVSMDDLKQFRQWGSKTPGHPENFETDGIEVTTGPLGMGISNAVGLAAAEAHNAAVYNKEGLPLIDHYTYCIMGDGCLQEGISHESSAYAGHLGLGKLIAFWDDNGITIDGHTELSFTEDVAKRYEAYGWQVLTVADGNRDVDAIRKAIADAKACKDKPTLVRVRRSSALARPTRRTATMPTVLPSARMRPRRRASSWAGSMGSSRSPPACMTSSRPTRRRARRSSPRAGWMRCLSALRRTRARPRASGRRIVSTP